MVGGDAPAEDAPELGGLGGGVLDPIWLGGAEGTGGGLLVVMTALCLQLTLDDCSRFTKLVISELRSHQRPITRHYNS